MYKLYYDNNGKLDSINRISDGAGLLYNSQTKTFNESHPFTIELRQWEQETGVPLDLSDRPPDNVPPPEPNWSEFLNVMHGADLIARIYESAKTSSEVNSAFGLLMYCLTSLYNSQLLSIALTDLQTYVQPQFSEDEIDFINQALLNNNFTFQLNINN